MQTPRGRRRAAGPAATPRAVEAIQAAEAPRPRDLHRDARRRRGPFRQITEFASASGIGQKAGIALAATGLVLTVTVPVTSPVMATDASGTGAVAASSVTPQPAISAEAGAQIDFSRSAVVTQADPDGKLKQLLSAQSAGSVSRAASAGTLGAPLATMATASPFGYRVSPITGGTGDFHRGQDYVAQCGTSVMAAATGTVTFVGWHQYGGGNRVVVDHGNGLETTYNHLSSFNVTEGQTVSRGDVIALSGTTGASTGCHLHFEVQVNGEVVDPTGWL
ncbi:Peptidase M23 [Pseudarthrobacter chlorophenolicus A6]|uniref:Peptidase M23 n=1 Tax=Pseudarthrobacter chlorophenolicus (strain ATCC 700700 / DSM 12829 / CIP 107037 / JCM 12360 / KCTC 9906 / NCIMB 13794 / A6) TaxID=452863 RepID=B8HDA2_PSECP|nr:Peptidase M23 [Pseudarthrobacter chlorophenolicus A6]SDR07146.1 Murein DD-endopeptidase MepM and murein hydrolase activator NlpD, contain LysM domain [Pseudarthrobacter chlorophenolicus]